MGEAGGGGDFKKGQAYVICTACRYPGFAKNNPAGKEVFWFGGD